MHINAVRRSTAAWPILLLALVAGQALGASSASAQDGSIQGIIVDEASQPLRGAHVVVEQGERTRAALTDRNGLFQIGGLRPGEYLVRITLFGYSRHEERVRLEAGGIITLNRTLTVAPVQLEGISVAGQGPGAVRRELGGQTITARELAGVPTPAATGDLVSYLQTQPGAVGSGDRGGQLFIRGGTPSENMVLMDGMLVYQPFHITGLFSTFPENLIQSAEFFAGGFGPQYSGRMSSVLDVQMRDGNRNDGSAMGAVSPFLAEFAAEGPIGGSGARESYIVSYRRSLIRETSPWLLGEEQSLGFDSGYLRLSHFNEDGSSRCSLTVMRSSDWGGLDPEDVVSRVGWTNTLVGGRCSTLAGATFMDVRFGRSSVSSEAVTRGASEFYSSASRIFVDADVSRLVGRVRLNAGGHVHVKDTEYDLQELLAQASRLDDGWYETGLYAELDVPVGGGLRLLPGAAISVARERRRSLEPRLRAAWDVPGLDAEMHGAVGVYEQRLSGVSDRRDASSIFTAWVRVPTDSRMRAIHAQGGWEQTIGYGFSYSVDVYYRRMYDLPVTTWSTIARFAPELAIAEGHSHGGDARIEFRHGPVYLFGGYGYGWTEYRSAQDDFGVWFGEPVQSYRPPHDRRHQANVLGSVELGRSTVAARWEFGSGFPFTRPIGFDEVIDFRTDHSPLPRVTRTFGETRVLLDRPYTGRLPPTHRLDISARRPVDVGTWELELQAGVINAYNQTNMFYYDVFADRRIDQLPFTPYVSGKLQPRPRTRR
jgi:hypothetical protein